jgi:RNA polymerase sigma-70 factor (ECF subfamily)
VKTSTQEGGTLSESDGELIAAACADPHAFTAVFDRHYDAIAGWLRRRVERALADELAAETFLQAFGARERYDRARADARPWLYGIAANLLRGHRRGEERRLRAYARAAQPAADLGAFDGVEARVDAVAAGAALASALATLGPGERDALLLHAWTDLTYEQIAEALEVPVGTVRSRINRARRVVREQLTADDLTLAVKEPR